MGSYFVCLATKVQLARDRNYDALQDNVLDRIQNLGVPVRLQISEAVEKKARALEPSEFRDLLQTAIADALTSAAPSDSKSEQPTLQAQISNLVEQIIRIETLLSDAREIGEWGWHKQVDYLAQKFEAQPLIGLKAWSQFLGQQSLGLSKAIARGPGLGVSMASATPFESAAWTLGSRSISAWTSSSRRLLHCSVAVAAWSVPFNILTGTTLRRAAGQLVPAREGDSIELYAPSERARRTRA